MKKEDIVYLFSMMVSKWINFGKKPLSKSFQKILIVKLDEIGDLVNSLHVFSLLKSKYPEAELTLLCKPFNINLLKNDPFLTHVVSDIQHLTGNYDLIVELRGDISTIKYALKNSPDYRIDRATVRWKNKFSGGHPHEVETNFQILEPLNISRPAKFELNLYPSQNDKIVVNNYLKEKDIVSFAVIHVGARRALKRWNILNFQILVKELSRHKKLQIVFVGDKDDDLIIKEIQKNVGIKTYSVAGIFTLLQVSVLCNLSKIFIGNDSGPLHIAKASDAAVIGLFGPGAPTTFYPYGERASYIHHVLSCNPCDQIHCVRPEYTCMDMISINEVMEKVNLYC